MPCYDCTFILNPQLEEAVLEGHIKDAKDLIDKQGGKLVKDNRIGMRRLAYEINKLTQGYYVSLVFDGNGDTVSQLERQFRLNENVLRFLTCLYKEFEKRDVRPTRRPYGETGVKSERPAGAASATEPEKPAEEAKAATEPEKPAEEAKAATELEKPAEETKPVEPEEL